METQLSFPLTEAFACPEPSVKVSSLAMLVSLGFHFLLSASVKILLSLEQGFPCGLAGKESTCNAGDLGSIPGLGRSPREGKGYSLQYSGLENSME